MISRWQAALIAWALAACGSESPPSTSGEGGNGGEPAAYCESRPEGRSVVDIAIVRSGGFALLSDGTVWCWAYSPASACPAGGLPEQILGLPCASSISAYYNEQLGVLTTRGEVWMKGDLTYGEPTRVADRAARWADARGTLVAWGDGATTLWWGDADFMVAPASTPQSFPHPAERLFIGDVHACYLQRGELFCFGRNEDGQLGDGTIAADLTVYQQTPVRARIDAQVQTAALMAGRTYALDTTGMVWTWGYDTWSSEPNGPLPLPWPEVSPAKGLTRSGTAGCVWNDQAEVQCWGRNPYYLLAYEDPYANPPEHYGPYEPMRMPDLEPAKEVDIGDEGPLCALKTDGTVWCRGWDGAGSKIHNDDGSAAPVLFEDHP